MNGLNKLIRLALVALGFAAFAPVAQAATPSWSLSNVQKEGVNVNGLMYFLVDENISRDSIAALAGKGTAAFNAALSKQSVHAFEWEVKDGSGSLKHKDRGQPSLSKLGMNEDKTYNFYALVFDTKTITDKSRFYLTALTPYKTGKRDANTSIYFGNQATASAATGAWKGVTPLPIPVKYLDAAGKEQTTNALPVEASASRVTWNAGWYVVNSEVTLSKGADCSGAVKLILADGAKLTINNVDANKAGIGVSGDGNSLTIYGQTAGTGALDTTGGVNGAGIGGGYEGSGSNITINGGTVTANSGVNGAGIGGGYDGAGSNITINGGTVTATSVYDAGIGGGFCGAGTHITINGGTVTATSVYDAGIGGGCDGDGTNITINGGTVTANGGEGAAGIGGGYEGSASNIFVADNILLKADNNNPPTTVIPHESIMTDISDSLDGQQYATAAVLEFVTIEPQAVANTTSYKVYTNDTVLVSENASGVVRWGAEVTVTYTADEAYVFPDGEATWTTNFTANAETVTVTIPKSEKPVLKLVTFTIADVVNTTKEVVGATLVSGTTYTAVPGAEITVTYTADFGYFFADGKKTSVVEDTAKKDITITTEAERVVAAATIGTTQDFFTLEAAAAAAKDGDTVTLLKDVTTTAYVVFDKNSNVTLDLNGKTISSATDECIVVGKQGDSPLGTGTLTITGEGKVVQTYAGSDADVVWARWGNVVIENGYFEVNGTYQCVYSTSGSKVTINGGTFKNLTGGDVLNVSNTGATTDIQCFGGSFSKDPELGDDAMGGSFVAEGYYSRENEDLWSVFALPLVTATKITEGVPEDVDAAYQFSTDETAEGSFFATWEANFNVSFSKDIAAGTVELAGQYGEYPWTAMPLTEDLAAGETWTLLKAGTLNFTELCAMKDFFCAIKNLTQANLGAGITVELTLSNGTKTYVLKTVDETFVRDLSPKAKIEELAEKPANLDVAYNCLPTTDEDAFYNGWEANITVSFDKPVTAGSLVLSGQYNTYDWTPYPITEDLAANEEIALLPAGLVHYQDLYKMLGGFNCGVKNLDGDNVGTKMTVKIVLTSGEETVVMGEQGYTLKFNLPEAEVTKITEGVPEGVDAAYKFSTTESGEGSFFAKWEANFNVSFSKAVKAGTVELAGQYGEYPWTPMALTKDLAAGEKWTLLPAGTVNYEELCAMKDFFCAVKNLANENIGTGITVELTLTDGEKTYVVTTVDETLYQLGSPTAAITEVTPAGKNLDAEFNCQTTCKQEARFDKWGANFTVTFNKPVKAGSVILSGQYNEYPWTPMVLDRDLEAGEAWTLLEEGLVAVEDLYKMVGGFNCGIKNVSTANEGTTVTVKIVVNNGEKTFESATKDYTLAFNPPTATVTKMAPVPETLDDAYTFAVAADEVGEGTKSPFQDWTADFTVSFSKPIAAGTVTLAGAYEAWQQGAWVSYDLPALAAGEEYAVLKGFGLDTKLTYRELCDIVKSFDCGVLNNLKANEGTVMTVKLVMAKGDETYMVTDVTSTLVKKSEEIDLGGGIKAKDFDNGDIEISGEGELTDVSKLAGHPITNLVVGSGITKIAANTFKNNRDLRTVTIGENCVEIGESAFGKVRNISNVVVKGSTKVADYAFLRCNSLEKLTFEGEVTFGKTPFAIHSAIYMKDGMPEIYTIPEVVIAGYRQALMGTNELKGEETEWTEITDEAEKANYHFFKVELKQVED